MKQPWLLLVLISFCTGEDWTAPDFCHNQKCPEYKLVNTFKDFEERLYVTTEWITTKVEGTQNSDVLAAHSRLKEYCQNQKEAGYEIPVDTWPVLLTVTKDKNMRMSWFIPPGTSMPENLTDSSVSLTTRPAGTVYIRIFGGIPSFDRGEENGKQLRDALVKARKTSADSFSAAGYESYFSLSHHNEVWIQAE